MLKKWIILIATTSMLLCSCSSNSYRTSDFTDNHQEPTNQVTFEPTITPTLAPTSTPTPTPEPEPFENMTTYLDGQYKVGLDIPADEYVLLSTSGSGYFSVTSDANGKDILFNDNFDVNSIITVYDGEYLKLSRCFAVSVEEFYSSYYIKADSPGVMLMVGKDIEAGEYKIQATDDSGYYCIYDSSRHDNIVSNDNFNGSRYVSVNDGEYLVLNRCALVQ